MFEFVTPNGDPIVAILETLPGSVGISSISDDGTEVEYDGTGSTLFWDDQEPVKRNGSFVFLDEGGGEWSFDQLRKASDSEDGEEGDDDEWPVTFDQALEAFKANPSKATAGALLKEAMTYEVDDMLGDDTFFDVLAKVRDWLVSE